MARTRLRPAPAALAVLLMGICAVTVVGAGGPSATVRGVLEASGVSGGLVVHLGCGEGKATAALRTGDAFLVQGLDTDADAIAAARVRFRSQDVSGVVTAGVFDGRRLPYVDNVVNLVVADELGQVPMGEVLRVLRPGGVAMVGGKKTVKPWPDEIDEWTHYLYDAKGTGVSNDRLAGHPRGLRWTGGPFWARSHEHTASMTAMVSAAGRVFYVMDEGPVASIQLPSRQMITARDAFNGAVLWKRPVPDWWNHLYPVKSGPGWLPRRLVAVGERVYVAPGVGHDLLCLDAVTGKTVRTYDGTASTFELVVSDGVVFAAIDTDRKPCTYRQQNANCWKERDRASKLWQWDVETGTRLVKAIEAETGKVLWKQEAAAAPMTLAADGRKVCFYDGSAVVALDRKTGKELWKTDVRVMRQIRTGYAGPRLVLLKDRVLLSPMGDMVALAADTGKVLWTVKKKPRSGHYSLEDFYVIGDRVWVMGRSNRGAFTTYALSSGEQLQVYSNPINSFYIHQRCYPGRATRRVLLPPIMGIQVYDIQDDAWTNNHWVRGGCVYGIMPANGMVYAVPHACACYYQSKLNGFNGLAPEPQPCQAPPADARLVKGPAYGSADGPAAYPAAAWPVFRHDNTRGGFAETEVPAEVAPVWQTDLGTKLTQPVVAGGRLLTSAVETHTVYALDAATGKEAWHVVAGGRVNSPPTLYKGLALFGCADGCIYAVRASDGELAWRFRAAPTDRQLVAFGRLESVWPVDGSVLVHDGKVYAVAGRSMFLDGGLRMVVLEPETGRLVAENVMDRGVPGADKQLDDLMMGKHLPVAMPDILSSDGTYIYMKSQTFTAEGKRVRVRPQRPDTQYGEEVHLFAPVSFLDDAWHQRTYWIYGRAAGEGWAEFQFPPKRVPCGRIICLDDENAYAFGRDAELVCNCSVIEYRLYCAAKRPSREVGIKRLEGKWIEGQTPDDKSLASNSVDWHGLAKLPKEKLSALDYRWVHEEPPVMARAMVLAGQRLFVAGPRDVVDEKTMWGRSNESEFQDTMAEQAAHLRGEHGAVLQVFSKTDGSKLAERHLDAMPAFDGLVAAEGRLYCVTTDGRVIALAGKP